MQWLLGCEVQLSEHRAASRGPLQPLAERGGDTEADALLGDPSSSHHNVGPRNPPNSPVNSDNGILV